ncbi:hypothetical protein MPSEU_000449000 [Mayamaea pseudoterrestris]|nr:hypothetical protein MPSEU_000449000 [Mayamaea pseudoterrestris]
MNGYKRLYIMPQTRRRSRNTTSDSSTKQQVVVVADDEEEDETDKSSQHQQHFNNVLNRQPAHVAAAAASQSTTNSVFPVTSTSDALFVPPFLGRYVTPTDDWSHLKSRSHRSAMNPSATPSSSASSTTTTAKPLQRKHASHPREPLPNDVVCGRGKGSYNCPGNRKFRAVVKKYMHQYVTAKTKVDKSTVLQAVLNSFVSATNGRFVKYDKSLQTYVEIPLHEAREKVGHAMREALAAEELVEGKQEAQHAFQVKHKSLLEQQREIFEKMVKESA